MKEIDEKPIETVGIVLHYGAELLRSNPKSTLLWKVSNVCDRLSRSRTREEIARWRWPDLLRWVVVDSDGTAWTNIQDHDWRQLDGNR